MQSEVINYGDEQPESVGGTALVPRATVRDMVARRQKSLDAFDAYYLTLAAAGKGGSDAFTAFRAIDQRGRDDRYIGQDHAKAQEAHFLHGLKCPTPTDFKTEARKMVDRRMWAVLVEITDLERLMDKKAKDELHKQIGGDDVPEATEDNIFATIQQFACDADTIFKRGIANCFMALDRRFRSHDGWKIGSRVILTGAFNEYGGWSYHRSQRDTLHDIDRTFHVIDGKDNPQLHGGIVNVVEQARGQYGGVRQSEHNSEYFKIKCYQNGNAHVWFKRDDLVEKVNKLLGEYYGAPLTDQNEPEDDGGLNTPKTSLAKNYGFYPTPDAAAEEVLERMPHRHYSDDEKKPLTVLEPSAGTGNLAKLAVARNCVVDCIEYQPAMAVGLKEQGIYRNVTCGDFLAQEPDPKKLYDRVLMNPPFDRERDIDHVMHALKFLKPGGCLVAVMSASTEFRETKKSKSFRERMDNMKAVFRDLPAGSFSSVGTYCNTLTIRVWADGRMQHGW